MSGNEAEQRASLKSRLKKITYLFLLAFAILILQLVRWQLVKGASFAEAAKKQYAKYETIEALRGTIFSHDGRPLATDIYSCSLSASPSAIEDPRELADRLFPLISVQRDELAQKLSSESVWQPLADSVPLRVADEISSWDVPGLTLEPKLSRAYPDAGITEPILGFVNRARDGYYGIEGYYDPVLRGEPGAKLGDLDLVGLDLPFGNSDLEPAKNGSDIYLTIDSRVQYVLWRELRAGLEKYKAESGSIIVINPKTGAVIGAVTLPGYDPNHYEQIDSKLYEDPIVGHEYEPGSVFKVITMAAGLDAGAVQKDSVYDDKGVFEIAGITVRNWDNSAHGPVTMTEILAYSLNTGASYVSTTLGAERFYEYIKAFGFGEMSGIDLQGEAKGSVKAPGDGHWYEADLSTNSFGQGIACTPLQMVASVGVIANNGMMMRPYIVEKIVNGEQIQETQPQAVRQVLKPETAATLTEMMVEAVEKETVAAKVDGYRVAGKTGTAQIPIPGGYHPSDTIASFVGFLPAEDPEVCILVKIDKPKASQWGSQVAAPIFSRVASELMLLMGVAPQPVTLAQGK